MYRNVDLTSYVPWEVIGKSLEFRWLFKAMNDEFADAWELTSWTREAAFIFSADVGGISIWETFLELPHDGTLEERRNRVYIAWNRRNIWTHTTFEQWLDRKIGRGNYGLEIHYGKYAVEIRIYANTDYDLGTLEAEIRKIIPANLSHYFHIVFARILEAETQRGDLVYPCFLCGEHECGTIPENRHRGEAYTVGLDVNTARNDAEEYKGYTNDGHRAGELRNYTEELIYMQDFKAGSRYEFGGEND